MSATASRTIASQSAQATASRIRTVPETMPWSGITLGAAPAWMLPQTTLTPARGSIRRLSTAGSSVVTLARAKVRSPVRCGRLVCPPVPLRRTSTRSAALVNGPSRRPDLADVDARVAVQREDPLDAVQGALVEELDGATRHDLLGRLEEQPHAAGQQALRVHLGQGVGRARPAPPCGRRGRRRGRPR